MKMIYEPVTEFGKKIASLLRFDDGVRLDIHDYLEEVEPELKEIIKKAEKWDEVYDLTGHVEPKHIAASLKQLRWQVERGVKQLVAVEKWILTPNSGLEELEEIMGVSQFTTNSEESE